MHSCGHDNCFTCPFRDCIVNGVEPDGIVVHKTGRKKTLTPDQKLEKKREWQKEYYKRNREKILAKCKEKKKEKQAV